MLLLKQLATLSSFVFSFSTKQACEKGLTELIAGRPQGIKMLWQIQGRK